MDYKTYITDKDIAELAAGRKPYASQALGKDNFTLPAGTDQYRVETGTGPDGELQYLVRARFNLDTPLGQILPFLENGGSIKLKAKDGTQMELKLERVGE